jgi:hypothetical protein
MHTLKKRLRPDFLMLSLCILLSGVIGMNPAYSQDAGQASKAEPAKSLRLGQAVMCEDIKDYLPYNRAVVFSLEIGQVFCFTSFDVVPDKMFIYHNWYRQDRLITTKRLSLQPPDWSTYSSIQLREADKGPWRVEIRDEKNQLFQIVRFSITD